LEKSLYKNGKMDNVPIPKSIFKIVNCEYFLETLSYAKEYAIHKKTEMKIYKSPFK
jgi:hypothetical protein